MNYLENIATATLLGLMLIIPTCQQVGAYNKPFATDDHTRYDKDLSKLNSDLPSRTSLAFFVPKICNASQAIQIDSTTFFNPLAFKTLMGNTVYDGLTLPNKRALGRISKAVSIKTESKTRHLLPVFNTVYSVALTQNLIGVSRND